jgi:hypothetical protein
MKKMVYKFLDEYLGDEVTCKKSGSTNRHNTYGIFSTKNKSLILFLRVYHKEGDIAMFRGAILTRTVSDFFSIEENYSTKIIKDWFGEKHNIKKVKDIMKFVN